MTAKYSEGVVFYTPSRYWLTPSMTHTTQLIYLAFGAATYQREALFSMVSALTHAARCKHTESFHIRVFTDTPSFFEKLPVSTCLIDPSWAGPHGYHFRIKHAVLKEVLQNCEKAILIDTDTFFRESPSALFRRVLPGKLLCNAIGRPLSEAPDLPRAVLARLEQANLPFASLRQTNSGVIGLTRDDQYLLEQSIAWMDELRPLAPELYTLEELCLALAAHDRLELNSCTDVIHHYWSRKGQFRAKIDAWVTKHHTYPLSEEAMHDALLLNDRLPRPTQPYRGWQKLVTRLVPSERRQFFRELLYGCHAYPNEFDRACASVWWDKAVINAQERIGRPLTPNELRAWLHDPLLKMLAGNHYSALHSHILARFPAN